MTQIKQLEWYQLPFQRDEKWMAEPIKNYLKYVIMKYNMKYNTHIDEKYLVYINSDLKKHAHDLNEAMHKAQADFENKIGGCLS